MMLEDLPDSWRDSGPQRYEGPARISLTTPSPLASQYILYGRGLLGELRNQLSLGGIRTGIWHRVLPDGCFVTVYYDGATNGIIVTPPGGKRGRVRRLSSPETAFLVYEKTREYGPFGFGYWYDLDRRRQGRETPYLINEPQEGGGGEYNSITKIQYQQRDLGVKLFEGRNLRFGNQYLFGRPPSLSLYTDGSDAGSDAPIQPVVYSWWGSPFGDLPHLVLPRLDSLIATAQRYMPAFIEESYGYYYLTEERFIPAAVPLDIYANGAPLCKMPITEGRAMIAGVGLSDQGDLLIALEYGPTIELFCWNETQAEPVSCGIMATGEEYVSSVWRFNEDATKVGGVILEENLTVVEFAVSYRQETGKYVPTLIDKKSYEGKRTYTEMGANGYINEYKNENYEITGTYLVSHVGVKSTTTETLLPFCVTYRNGVREVYEIKKTSTQGIIYSNKNDSTMSSKSPLAGCPKPYDNNRVSKVDNKDVLETLKQNNLAITTQITRNGIVIHTIDDIHRDYQYNKYTSTTVTSGDNYQDFTVCKCPGDESPSPPASANWTLVSEDAQRYVNHTVDSNATTGLDSQLLHFSAQHQTVMAVQVVYDVVDSRVFGRTGDMSREDTQVVILYGCSEGTASVNSSCSFGASAECKDTITDKSIATFIIQSAGRGMGPSEGASYPLNDSELIGPYTSSGSAAGGNSWQSGEPGCGSGGSESAYANWVQVAQAAPAFPAPGWAGSIGLTLPGNILNGSFEHATTSPIKTRMGDVHELCNRYFIGASSLTLDPSLEHSGTVWTSILDRSITKEAPIYIASSAGVLIDPTYTWTPDAILDKGGVPVQHTASSFPGVTANLGIKNATLYPIGWTMRIIEFEEIIA